MPHLFKVLVLGAPEALKEHICKNILSAHTESFSHSYKQTLGVSFHAAKLMYEGYVVNWQICDIYEQHRWISKFLAIFVTGTSGIIIVVDSANDKSSEIAMEWLQWLADKQLPNSLPISILEITNFSSTNKNASSQNLANKTHLFDQFFPLLDISHHKINAEATNTNLLPQLAERIINSGTYISGFDGAAFWTGVAFWKPTNPKAVRQLLKKVIDQADKHIENDEFAFRNSYGRFKISLRTGDTYLEPAKCENCRNQCSKRVYVCMQKKGQGWMNRSSVDQRVLLIVSKIYAIVNEAFNSSVLAKVHEAAQCRNFKEIPEKESKKSSMKEKHSEDPNQSGETTPLEELKARYTENL
ncbi:MAG: hypothetical protein ACFFC7_06030 [Candidatus Hermodarchaeota archaeon]